MGQRATRTPAVLRRGAHHGLVLCAAGLAVLLAATVLAALAVLAERAVEAGARERLALDDDAAVEVTGRYGPGAPREASRTDRAVREAIGRTFQGVAHHTWSASRAPAALSGALPVSGADGRIREGLTVSVVTLQAQGRHADLLNGRWPRGRSGPFVEAALPRALAARLAVPVGGEFSVDTAGTGATRFKVTGTFTSDGRSPAVWNALPGTYGTPESVVLVGRTGFAATPALARDAGDLWLGLPDTTRIELSDTGPLAARLATFSGSDTTKSVFRGEPGAPTGFAVVDGLGGALDALKTPVAVSRAGLYVPATLLAALATAALVLTARQLAEHRRPELAVLAARGAGTPRLAGATALHWAAAAVPAGLAAPFLAGPLLRALDRAGLVPGGAPPATGVLAAAWAVALLAVLVHGAAVLLPTVRAVRDRRAVSRPRLRTGRFSGAQRAGTDLALAVVAVVGWLQLRQYRSPVGDGGTVDPVLVLAPVAMTTAAALLVLRLLPIAGRLTDPLARRGTGLVLPLGGWQIGRGAARHAGPTLVVALALAVGALSSTALAVLDRGDHDQAVFGVGSDLRVEPGPSGGVEGGERRQAYAGLPGVTSVTPLVDMEGWVGEEPVGITALNTATGPVPHLRSDLSDRPLAELLAPLGRTVPEHGIRLEGQGVAFGGTGGSGPEGGVVRPGGTGGSGADSGTVPSRETGASLPLRVRLDADGPGTPVPVRLTVTFEDGDGLAHRGSVDITETGTEPRTVRLPLPARTAPLRILRLGFAMRGETVRRTYRLTVDRVPGIAARGPWREAGPSPQGRGAAGCPGYARGGDPAGPPPEQSDPRLWEPAPGPVLCSDRTRPGTLVDGVLRGPELPAEYPHWETTLATGLTADRPAVPALADRALLDTGKVRTGDRVKLTRPEGGTVEFLVTGAVGAVPGVDRDVPRLLADSRVLAAHLAAQGRLTDAETAWLADVRDGDAGAALRAVDADPGLGVAVDVPRRTAELADDPVRDGARGALNLCLVLAPAFAVIAFTLHTVLSARARRREFALLRALGVRRGQLSAYLWTEQLGLAALAALLGTVLGTALAAAIMPVVTVDADGTPVFPALLTPVPWGRVGLTAAATTALIFAVVTLAARFLARVDLARVLRAGDDG
ncbi:FtsX-like permease family protein [Streptomyces sp. NPDC050504]|uniref:ABC transporter permease n=1 Tax=Streptomyces sp. NPDC050504 TaxID=3365618 RepID=UPI003787718B